MQEHGQNQPRERGTILTDEYYLLLQVSGESLMKAVMR